jgi:hypothetical protein
LKFFSKKLNSENTFKNIFSRAKKKTWKVEKKVGGWERNILFGFLRGP